MRDRYLFHLLALCCTANGGTDANGDCYTDAYTDSDFACNHPYAYPSTLHAWAGLFGLATDRCGAV
jgi:hypothetical protein